MAYDVHEDGKNVYMVVDGERGPRFDQILGVDATGWVTCRFLAGNRLRYLAHSDDGSYYVVEAVWRCIPTRADDARAG